MLEKYRFPCWRYFQRAFKNIYPQLNDEGEMDRFIIAFCAFLITGCSAIDKLGHLPKTPGETNASFTYIPLDPLPVTSVAGASCGPAFVGLDISNLDANHPDNQKKPKIIKSLLTSLPDNAVRMAVKQVSGDIKLTFGASSVGLAGNRYQVVLDYINVDSTNIRFYIDMGKKIQGEALPVPIVRRIPDTLDVNNPGQSKFLSARDNIDETSNIVIPVYVGVGLRLTADIKVNSGTLNLASLGAIAAGVEAGNASGSLVVQTIGVTGKQVSVSLPMPSELNQTTVQNAILALGSIKAIIYDEKSSTITPRVTGIYLPIGDGSEELVNKIVSELARYPITWARPCTYEKTDVASNIQ